LLTGTKKVKHLLFRRKKTPDQTDYFTKMFRNNHFPINFSLHLLIMLSKVVSHLLPKRAWESSGEPRYQKCPFESHGITGLSKVRNTYET